MGLILRLMKFVPAIFLVSALLSCSGSREQKIVIPELASGFYSDALQRINDNLASDPDNINLIEQKIYYCDQLNWPSTCITALNDYKAKYGMTNQIVEDYIKFYQQHEHHQLLVDIIEKWDDEYDLLLTYQKPYIRSLVAIGDNKKAKGYLSQFLINNSNQENIAFAAQQYLELRDTLMATFNLSKLRKLNPGHNLMLTYGQLLLKYDHDIVGFNVLEDFHTTQEKDEVLSLRIARMYEEQNWLQDARDKIKPFVSKDTIAYMITDWYARELLWDSAVMYIDTVLTKNSSNAKAWWKRARIYEDRGWLSYSLKYFEKVLEINPDDTIASNRIDLIQRKIAYLQRQKFEENRLPILEFEPTKIKN